jgi:hypothetical protein
VSNDGNELAPAAAAERELLTTLSLSGDKPREPEDPPADSLAGRVRSALFAVPENFQGVQAPPLQAPDVHTLSGVLGSTIEQEVVETLNRLRNTTWDPDGELAGYRFVRQAQVFPDVVLKATDPDLTPSIKLGIELKGWYALAKEREPNFRFKATPLSCAEEDMLVVFPWALSRVISGEAQVFPPWIVNARYAAEYRNWHWIHSMGAKAPADSERAIHLSLVTSTYPESRTEEHNDEATNDKGDNFGRTARTNLMNAYIDRVFSDEALAGVAMGYWQRFLKLFGRDDPPEKILGAIDRMGKEFRGRGASVRRRQLEDLREQIVDLANALNAMAGD